jgi:hypothetical protein
MFEIGDNVVVSYRDRDEVQVGVKDGMRGVVVGYSGRVVSENLQKIMVAVRFPYFSGGHCCGTYVYDKKYSRIEINSSSTEHFWCDPEDIILASEIKSDNSVNLKFKIRDRVVYNPDGIFLNMRGRFGTILGACFSGKRGYVDYVVAIDGFKDGHGCNMHLDGNDGSVVGSWETGSRISRRKDLWWCSESDLSLISAKSMDDDVLKSTLVKAKEESSREYFISRFPQISKIIRLSGRTGHPITIVVLMDGRKGIVRLQEGDVDSFDVAVLYAYIKAKEKKVVVIDQAYQIRRSNGGSAIVLRNGK